MSFYVFAEHIDSERINFLGSFNSKKEAVEKIRICLNVDANCAMKNEYYYFIEIH